MFTGPNIITDGLVLYLDAANTNSYTGSGTTWNDVSGNGNTGTLVNGPTFNSGNGGSIVFDGGNDYFIINNFTPISTQFSITSFIYPTITTGGSDRNTYGGTVFSQDTTTSGARYPLWFRIRGTELSYSIWNSNAGGNTTVGANIELNKWHYIAIVAEKNGILNIYHNNNLLVDSTSPNSGTWNGDFYIGELRAGRNILFGGKVSNTTVYNRLLSSVEIQQNYNATKSRYEL